MKKEEIHIEDIYRILFGQTPPVFLLEVAIRTTILYIILLYTVKMLGKRMSGQLTIMELAVILTMGAIVSVPIQMPDRGLLQGVLLLIIALLFQRGVSYLGFISGWFEDLTQGKSSKLVDDGILVLDQMKADRITRQQIFAELRIQQVHNLGMVERMYLEACGMFSVIKADEPRPGLPVFAPDDKEIYELQQPSFTTEARDTKQVACESCGFVKQENDASPCQNCGQNKWVKAIK